LSRPYSSARNRQFDSFLVLLRILTLSLISLATAGMSERRCEWTKSGREERSCLRPIKASLLTLCNTDRLNSTRPLKIRFAKNSISYWERKRACLLFSLKKVHDFTVCQAVHGAKCSSFTNTHYFSLQICFRLDFLPDIFQILEPIS